MDNFEQRRRQILEVCFKELMVRRTNHPELKEMFRAIDKPERRGYNSNYGRYQ